jgi:hypothetical protein
MFPKFVRHVAFFLIGLMLSVMLITCITPARAQSAARLKASRIASEQSVKNYYLQSACEKVAGFAEAIHGDMLAGASYADEAASFDESIAELKARDQLPPGWFIQAAPKIIQLVYNMNKTKDSLKVKATYRIVCLNKPEMFYINPNAMN